MVHTDGARGPDGEFGAVGTFRVRGNPQQVWMTVADVESQPQYMPGVKQAQVEEVEEDGTKLVHQVLQWGFLALQGDMHFHLEQREDPSALTISTKLRRGTMMRRFSSRVEVRDAGAGCCDVEMLMFMQPAIFVPPLIRHLVGLQVRRQLSTVLCALRDRLEHMGSSDSGDEGGDNAKIAAEAPAAAGAAAQQTAAAAAAGAVSAAVADLRAVAVAAAVAAVAVGAALPPLETPSTNSADGNLLVSGEPVAAAAAPAVTAGPASTGGSSEESSEDGFVFVTAADAAAEAAAAAAGNSAPPQGLQMAALSPQAVDACVAAAAAAEGAAAPAPASDNSSGEQWNTGSEEEQESEVVSDGGDDTAASGVPDVCARPTATAAAVAKQAAAVARRASCDVVAAIA